MHIHERVCHVATANRRTSQATSRSTVTAPAYITQCSRSKWLHNFVAFSSICSKHLQHTVLNDRIECRPCKGLSCYDHPLKKLGPTFSRFGPIGACLAMKEQLKYWLKPLADVPELHHYTRLLRTRQMSSSAFYNIQQRNINNSISNRRNMSPKRRSYPASSNNRTYELSVWVKWQNESVALRSPQGYHRFIQVTTTVCRRSPGRTSRISRTSAARHIAELHLPSSTSP